MSKDGWREYMDESAATGPAVTLARCFSSGCNERVRRRFFEQYLSPAQFDKYTEYALAAFVQGDRQLVQCTGADCDQVMHMNSLQAHDLECSKCKTVFCSSCGAEGHQPASCAQLRAWEKKNTDEGENITWIQANTKPCPKCHVNIEKNQGCNHMTCRKDTGGCGESATATVTTVFLWAQSACPTHVPAQQHACMYNCRLSILLAVPGKLERPQQMRAPEATG